MSQPVIQFDEEKHEYRVNGRRMPSVTEVLAPLYGDLRFVDEDVLQRKSEIGKAVHKAVELHVLGTLDTDSLHPVVAPYYRQFLKFLDESKFAPGAAERKVFSPFGYCGTLDLDGRLNSRLALIDVKTTAKISPVVALQTAAYTNARNASEHDPSNHVRERYALRLSPDNYRLVRFPADTYHSDFAAFLGLLRVHQWCQANGTKITGAHQ